MIGISGNAASDDRGQLNVTGIAVVPSATSVCPARGSVLTERPMHNKIVATSFLLLPSYV
jgi:hypothetical protein